MPGRRTADVVGRPSDGRRTAVGRSDGRRPDGRRAGGRRRSGLPRRDGGRAWAVEFDHLGPQPLLQATATGGAAVVVTRKRAGAATSKQITARVEGGNAETIAVVVRPKVKAPKLRLAAAEVVTGREDEVVADLFGGVVVEAAGVVAIEANPR